MEITEDSSENNRTPKSQNSGNVVLQTIEVSEECEPESRLLDLPPELRTEIYRLCVVKYGRPTLIDEEFKLPALLSTCRQIRQEAIELWCTSNDFELEPDGDFSLYHAWMTRIIKPLDLESMFRVELFIGEVGWRDLVQWCRAVWSKEVEPLNAQGYRSPEWALIDAAQNIAFHCRQLAWEKVVGQLDGLKVVAGHMDDLYSLVLEDKSDDES